MVDNGGLPHESGYRSPQVAISKENGLEDTKTLVLQRILDYPQKAALEYVDMSAMSEEERLEFTSIHNKQFLELALARGAKPKILACGCPATVYAVSSGTNKVRSAFGGFIDFTLKDGRANFLNVLLTEVNSVERQGLVTRLFEEWDILLEYIEKNKNT